MNALLIFVYEQLHIVLFVIVAILLSFWLLQNIYHQRRREQLPPGPWRLPILGNLLSLSATAPHVSLTALCRRWGPIVGLQLGQVYTVVLTDAELIREALRSDALTGRAPLFVTHGIMGGYGLICAEGPLWKDQRRLTASFLKTLGMLKFVCPTRDRLLVLIERNCAETVAALQTTCRCDPHSFLLHTMGNVMNALIFGIRYDRTDSTWLYLQELQAEGVRHIGVSGAVNFLPWLRHMPEQRRVLGFLLAGKRRTHRVYDAIIEQCVAKLETKQANNDDDGNTTATTNVLELFLREREARKDDAVRLAYCSDEQLRHLLADLFGAGVDTTMTTLRWLLLYVSRDEEIQRRIHDELSINNSSQNETFVYAKRQQLPYLRAAIAEAQRIRSVVPLGIPHGVKEPMKLGGYDLPIGTMIIPLQWAVHMNPDRWPEPERFQPERFLDAVTGEFRIPDGAGFMPFQSGKRACVGEELAHMMLFTYAAGILCEFRLKCVENASVINMGGDCGITLTPPKCEIEFIRWK